MARNLAFMHPWPERLGVHTPLFYAHAGRCPVGLEIGCVDYYGLLFVVVGLQTDHYLRKDAFIVPALATVV